MSRLIIPPPNNGAPSGYTTGAVAFDGFTLGYINALANQGSADTTKITAAAWFTNLQDFINWQATLWNFDPLNQYSALGLSDPPNTGRILWYFESNDENYTLGIPGSDGPSFNDGAWYGCLFSGDSTLNKYVLEVVKAGAASQFTSAGDGNTPVEAFTWTDIPIWIGFSGPQGGDDGTAQLGYGASIGWQGSAALLQAYPGMSILNDAGDAFTPEGRALFFSAANRPVDPAGAITALGTPAFLLEQPAGSNDPTQFVANAKGSGGPFSIIKGTARASLTNGSPTLSLSTFGFQGYTQTGFNAPGTPISGTGIPAATTISSAEIMINDESTTITMSQNASSDETATVVSFGSGALTLAPSSPSD